MRIARHHRLNVSIGKVYECLDQPEDLSLHVACDSFDEHVNVECDLVIATPTSVQLPCDKTNAVAERTFHVQMDVFAVGTEGKGTSAHLFADRFETSNDLLHLRLSDNALAS